MTATAAAPSTAATLGRYARAIGDAAIDAQRALEDDCRDRQLILERLLDQLAEVTGDMNARAGNMPQALDLARLDDIAARWILDDPTAPYVGADYVDPAEHTRILDLLRHARRDIADLYETGEELLTCLARAAVTNFELRDPNRRGQ